MGFLKRITLFSSVLLFSISVQSQEIASGSPNANSSGLYDYSNLPVRENIGQCTETSLRERQELQDSCLRDFSSRGLSETVTPDEIVQARSCDAIESFGEVLGGCAKAFILDVIGGIPSLILSLTPQERFAEQIELACGVRPQSAIFESAVTAGLVTSSEEQSEINAFLATRRTYNTCADGVIDQERATLRAASERAQAQIETFRGRCELEVSGGSRRERRINECILDIAVSENCESCIEELSGGLVATVRDVVRSIWDELRAAPSYQCFNKETQGRLACNLLAGATGSGSVLVVAGRLGVHGSRLVSRLPESVREGALRRVASLREATTSPYLQALERRAQPYTSPGEIPGGAGGVSSRGLSDGRYLRSSDIEGSDLPYTDGVRPQSAGVRRYTALSEIEQVEVTPTDIILASGSHSGSAGVVRLATLPDGRPVVIKSYSLTGADGRPLTADTSNLILQESRGLAIADDLGIGPRFHGI